MAAFTARNKQSSSPPIFKKQITCWNGENAVLGYALLKAHCRGSDWLVVMLRSKTKLWSLSNYQAFMLLDHTLFRELRESDHYHHHEVHCTAKLLSLA